MCITGKKKKDLEYREKTLRSTSSMASSTTKKMFLKAVCSLKLLYGVTKSGKIIARCVVESSLYFSPKLEK